MEAEMEVEYKGGRPQIFRRKGEGEEELILLRRSCNHMIIIISYYYLYSYSRGH